ncbi:MAG: molecular chaperone [Bacillota bacterium]
MRHILGLSLLVLPVFARAASLDVDPIRVVFSAQNTITVVTLTNSGDTPATVQLEPVAWSQDKGEDVYASTRDLLATPPIFTVQPHAKQIIRLGLRSKPDPVRERSFRLYLKEVPQALELKGMGVQMALRIGVPVFVAPIAPLKPSLQWTLKRVSDKELELDAVNDGNAHVQVKQITLTDPNGATLAVQQAAYVLPGANRSWRVPVPKPEKAGKFKLTADTDQGALNAQPVLP